MNASIPRELDRIVLKSLEIDPKSRYPNAAEMAADLERTLIAARYSSRELSKMLQELYRPSDDPVVVVEEEPEGKTQAITATTSIPTPERSPTVSRSDADSRRLVGAVRAEGNRLARSRWKGRAKVLFIALAVGTAVGGAVLAGKHYVPIALQRLKRPPPPPVTENQTTPGSQPEPAAPAPVKPGKKRVKRVKNTKGAAADPAAPAADTPAPAAEPPSGDEPLPLETK